MRNLIYTYTIDDHERLNEDLLAFFDTLPTKVGDQDYNLGISKFDGHNHHTAPFLPPQWQYQDSINDYNNLTEGQKDRDWKAFEERYPHIAYKRMFLDAAAPKFHEHALTHIQPDITGLNYRHNIMHMWYHQMQKSDYIGWDNHQYCQWSGVYFIEVPDPKYITEFLDHHSLEVMQPAATYAGDMIIFPSWLLHRAPIMQTDQRKSIISWNMDVTYVFSDEYLNSLKQTHPQNWNS